MDYRKIKYVDFIKQMKKEMEEQKKTDHLRMKRLTRNNNYGKLCNSYYCM